MADDGLRIVNTVDNSQVDNAFARMRKEIVSSAETAQQQGRKIDDALDRVALSANATSDTLKRRIHESSQVVNELTAKIIEQRAVVKDVQADVKRLGDAYKEAKAKGTYGASGILAEYNAAKKALEEEKSALFALNQEKQKASLKVKELRGQYELMKKATDDNVLSLGMLQKGFVALGGTMAVKAFTQQVIQTRGEFQQLEVAFTTMLGSAEKANTLMMQLTKTAAVTPFDLKGVTDGAKQLLAYGVAADEVNDTLIHLGDIAAGLSLPLGDLVYLYGTTLTQGRMFTQDLRQFMGRGIPIAEELAKQFGVTKDKVQELVSTGKVGAEEFKQAIMSMSSEGGKFGGLMEEQSKTITGQISNIEDAIDNAFNKIGKQSEGVINTALDGVSYLVENYEKVGKIILSVAGVYGTYKAAVLAVIAVEKIMAMARLAQIKQTTLCQLATDILTKKMALLNTTMMMNPWVLAATAIAGLIAVLVNLETEADRVREVNEEYNNTLDETIRKEEEHERRVNELIGIAGDEALSTDTRIEALQKLNNKYPQIFAKYKTEYEWLTHLRDIKAEIAELDGQTSHKKATVQKQDVDARIAQLEKKGSATYTTYTGMSGFTTYSQTGGRTAKEETELKELYKKREQLAKQIQKDKGDYYMTHLTGVSNADLDAQIKQRQNLLAKMKIEGKKYGKTTTGGAQGTYTADELSAQLNNLNAEKNRRTEARYTPAQRKAQLQTELANARKALADFDKSSTQYTVAEAEKKRKELQDAVTDAEKRFKAMGGSTSSSKSGGKTAKQQQAEQERQIREQERLNEMERKQKLAHLRKTEDLELETRQAILDAQVNSSDKILAQYQLDFDKQKLAIERGYEDLKQKKIDDARALFDANPANKGKAFDESMVDTTYTKEEEDNYKAMLQANEYAHQQNIEKYRETERSALNQYLKDYGDYEQKKLAIAQEYAQKIKDATTAGEKMSLERQMERELKELDMNQLKKEINWEVVFNDLDRVSLEHLKELKKNLKEALNGKDITAENAQIIAQQIERVNDAISNKQNEWKRVFGFVIPELEKQKRLKQEELEAQERLVQAEQRQAEALREVAEARQKIIDLAEREGVTIDTSTLNTGSEGDITELFQNMGKNTSELTDLFGKLGKAEAGAAEATEGLAGAQAEAGMAAEGAGGSFASTVAILDVIFHTVNQQVQEANELFKELGLEDTKFGKGFDKFAESSNYATQGWEDFKSGNVLGVINNNIKAWAKLGDALGEWGIAGMGASDSSLLDDIEKLTASNKDLEKAVSNLANMMEESAVVDAQGLYEQQKQKTEQSMANTLEMMQRSAKAYNNGFLGIGGSHSSSHKINEGVSSSEWDRISKLLGKNIRSAGDFFSLTSEEMYKVQTEATDIYSHIKDLADDGYQDAAKFMDEYCEYWETLKELENAYFEKLTSTSFDSLQSDFANALLDMDSDAETFADNFEKYMQNAIINSLVSEQYKPLLQKWYDAFASYMVDGTIDAADMEKLRNGGTYKDATTGKYESFTGWNSISESAVAMRDTLKDMFGWYGSDYKQEASTKGFQAMSQDTGDELNGRFTAIQIAAYDLKDLATARNEMLTRMEQNQGSVKTSVEGITDALAITNIHLSDIAKYTKHLIAMEEALEDIKDNTKHL